MANGNVSIDGIEFDLKANVDKSASSAIRSLGTSLKSLQDILAKGVNGSGAVKQITNLMNAVNSVSTLRADGLTMLIRSLSNLSKVKTPENLDKSANSLNNIVSATNAITPEMADTLVKYASALSMLSTVNIGSASRSMTKGLTSAYQTNDQASAYISSSFGYESKYSTKSIYGTYNPAKDWMYDQNGQQIEPGESTSAILDAKTIKEQEEFAKKLKQVRDEAIKDKSDIIYKRTSAFLNGFGNTVRTTTGYMGKFLSTSRDLAGGVWDKLTSGIRGSVAQFENLRRSFGRILLYRAIRTLIKDIGAAFQTGIADLYQYSTIMGGTFAKSMDTLSTSMLYLKNSMATMAAPLINAVAPAIDYLIDKVVALMNVIAQAMAALTGAGTWDKAIKFPKKYATAVGDANGAAKELEKTVLGFDELNRLNDNNNSSGGSGFSADDYSNMFTTESVTSKFKYMMNQSNWTKIGESIAEGLNAGLTKVDNWINTKFAPQAKIWATRMGTMLNGFVSKYNWSLLGMTVGDGLNSVIDAFNTFYASAGDAFTKIGSGIATSINGFFSTVDWSGVGLYLSNKLNAWVDVFSGFFTTLSQGAYTNGFDLGVMMKNFFLNIDWEGIRTGLSGMLKTIADTLEGFISGQDGSFDNFTTEFANTINSVFENPDTKRILDSLGKMFNSIIDGIKKLDWYSIGKTIGTALGDIDWANVLVTVGEGLLKGLAGIFDGLFNSSNGTATLALLGGLGILGGLFKVGNILTDNVLKQLTTDMATKLVGGEGLGALSAEGGTAMTGISGIGTKLGMGLTTAVLAAYDVQGIIKILDMTNQIADQHQQTYYAQNLEAATEYQELLKKGYTGTKDDILAAIQAGVDENDILAGNFSATVTETTGDIVTTTNGTVQGVKSTVHTYVNGILQDVDSTGKAISDSVSDNLSDADKENDSSWGDMSATAKARLDDMKLNADGSYTSIKKLVSDHMNDTTEINDNDWVSMSDTAKKKIDEMKTNTSNGMDNVSSHYSGSMDSMKTKTDNIWNSIGNTFDSWISNIQRSLSFNVNARYNFTTGGRMPEYATGGIVEDGLFMANHGELVGQFSNGKTAVANNQEIVAGIQDGVYAAMMAALGNTSSSEDGHVTNIYLDGELLDSYVANSSKRLALASGGR